VLRPITRQLQQNEYLTLPLKLILTFSSPGVIWALIWASFEFSQAANGEERNVDSTRSIAAQLIAIRVLRAMSSQDVVRALTLDFELPATPTGVDDSAGDLSMDTTVNPSHETQTLLGQSIPIDTDPESGPVSGRQNPAMSALEIALVGEALKFIASPIVQNVLQDIWKGNVVLWGDLDTNGSTARKQPSTYTWRRTAWVGYARLRVPRYRFVFQVANFSILLVLFLATLNQPDRDHISVQEILLDIWFLGFAYSELGGLLSTLWSDYP
jgi:hypothetical protein